MLPLPIAVFPITIWLFSPSALALVSFPMKIEVEPVSFIVVPSAIYLPDWKPKAILLFPLLERKDSEPKAKL